MTSLHTSRKLSFRHIVFATDFSTTADRALPYAVEIARRTHATVHAVHVISPRIFPAPSPDEWSQANQEEEEFTLRGKEKLEQELHDLKHEILVLKGDVWTLLKHVIKDTQADLVVMATHGRTGVAKALMGSIAERLFRQISCPVLTVGPGVHRAAVLGVAAELHRVLYATDFSPESLAAARYAISVAEDHHAQLILLHAGDGAEGPDLVLETLKTVVPLGAGLVSQPTCMMERGAPAAVIVKTAEANHADLIVIGARNVESHLGLVNNFSDSLATLIAATARCPVLTVHN